MNTTATELSEFPSSSTIVNVVSNKNNSSDSNSSHDSDERLTPNQNQNNYQESSSSPSSTTPSAAITDAQRKRLESFSFYTPRNILILFTLINFVVYYDRGVPGSAIPYIRVDPVITGGEGKPPLTNTECGSVYSAFMVGFFVFQPICVALGGCISSNRIILAGISAWCVAVIFAGAAQSYGQLLVARAFTGIGEAAYIAWSVTVLDDVAPPAQRSTWLSIFYCTIPFGNAMGIAVNSVIASTSGWRTGFFVEVIPMAILAGFVMFLPREYNVRVEDRGDPVVIDDEENNNNNVEKSHTNLLTAIYSLFSNENWVLLCAGYVVYTAALGALSFFAVSMLVQSTFGISVVQASLLLGLTTSAMGFAGSILGGKILDGLPGGSTGVIGLRNATSIMTVSMAVAIPLGFIALNSSSFTAFCVFFVPGVFCAFVVTAPMASSILSSVPSHLRPYSIAVNTLMIHLFGDFESPWITGKLADNFDAGCSVYNADRSLCENHLVDAETMLYCKFMGGGSGSGDNNSSSSATIGEKSSCVNPDELFKAMRIVWLFMLLTIPTWGYLAWKFRNEVMMKAMDTTVATTTTTTQEETVVRNNVAEEK